MKITDQTTLVQLQEYLSTLGNPAVTVVQSFRRASHRFQANVYLTGVGAFNGAGQTHAEAIEDALASLRQVLGVTNLAYEPLNYVRERGEEAREKLIGMHDLDAGQGTRGTVFVGLEPHPFEASDTGHCTRCGHLAASVIHEAPDGGRRSRIGVSLREQTERIMSTLTPREREVLAHRFPKSYACHGCGRPPVEHPNESGCNEWHDKP